jgi:hypothetical protein
MEPVVFMYLLIISLASGIVKQTCAAQINAAGCGYNDVSAAIASASAGDTVLVPAGSCAWSATLIITRGIRRAAAACFRLVFLEQPKKWINPGQRYN